MLEIRSDNSHNWRDIPLLFISIIILISFLYFILGLFEGDMLAFYVMSFILLILLIPFGVLALLPEKMVIDTLEDSIKNYLGKWKISEFSMRKISSVKYELTNKGYASLIVVKKDGTTFSMGSWRFREEDIRAAFDEISQYSEKYGFSVKETIEYSPAESPDTVISSNDESPYKIK